MGIGFQSFGGMLTGGDDSAVPVEETTVELKFKEEKKEEKKDNKEEIDEQSISYNDVNIEEEWY